MQDPAFAETCAWAVRASVDRGDHSGYLDGSVMEDLWGWDPEAPPCEDHRYRGGGGGGGGRGIADLLLDDHERHHVGPIF